MSGKLSGLPGLKSCGHCFKPQMADSSGVSRGSAVRPLVLHVTMNVMNGGKEDTLHKFGGDTKQPRKGSELASVAQVVPRKSWSHLYKGNREYRLDSGSCLQHETRLRTAAGTWGFQPPHCHLQKIPGCCFQSLSTEAARGSCSISWFRALLLPLRLQLALCRLILAGISLLEEGKSPYARTTSCAYAEPVCSEPRRESERRQRRTQPRGGAGGDGERGEGRKGAGTVRA